MDRTRPDEAGLTLDQAVDVVRRHTDRDRGKRGESGPGFTYLGDELLRCADCGAGLAGGHAAGGWYPDPHRASYHCTGCGKVSAPVTAVGREIQSLTRERLEQPAVVTRWRTQRLAALDADIAETRAALAWGRDPSRRAELGRKLGVHTGFGRRAAVYEGTYPLDAVASRLAGYLTEHAALRETPAGPGGGTRYVDELKLARMELFHLKHPVEQLRRRMPTGKVVRAVGGRRKYDAHEAEVDRQRLTLWDLLLDEECRWHNPEPAPPPAQDEALTRDWSQSPTREPKRRRKLLVLALGTDTLVVGPEKEEGKWTRIVRAEERRGG